MRSNSPMVRRFGRTVVAGTLLTLTTSAGAVVPAARPHAETATLQALAAASITKPLRTHKKLVFGQSKPGAAWQAFAARGGQWQSAWDAATGVPSRIWGEGISAPGTVNDPAVAERFARQFLTAHVALLAPGSTAADFELVANHYADGMRTLGFFQRAGGKRVLGGQVSFRFKADRLFVIGSEALPHVAFATPRSRLGLLKLREEAVSTMRAELGLPASAPVSQPGEEMILPLLAEDSVLGYRVVRPVTVDAGIDGRYIGYADVATGKVIAVKQMNAYANGTVKYRVADRHPARGRVDRVAPRVWVNIDGAPQTTSMAGGVAWGTDSSVVAETSVIGDLVSVENKAVGEVTAVASHALMPNGTAIWDASAVVEDDAQTNAYIATMRVKEYVREHVDPQMPTLDEQITVKVNVQQNCNAMYDGSILLFQASDSCQNTALIEDVVFHEYGHHVHTRELIPGVGDFDGAMSEGASDFLAASMTGDPGMGRGFYYIDKPLRDLDPVDSEWMWPRDVGEIHYTGQIYGGVFWDLRKDLIAQLGEPAGVALVNKLYVGTLRRAIDIPTSLIEALAEDDNDGNLANGTPHECAIRAAFGRHGMRTATGTVIAPGQLTENALAIGVHIEVTGRSETCAVDNVIGAEISWVPPFGGVPAAGTALATPAGNNKFFAQLPLAPQGSVYYKAKIKFADGSSLILADNFADPYYQLYQGETVKLYCTSFDTTNPFDEGWTTGAEGDNDAASPFAWGEPTGGPTDPQAAYSGDKILGMNLAGKYNNKQRAFVATPPIDIGRYSDVRVHYRRWLAVEDSHFDQAMVTANGKKAWLNLSADNGDNSALHHVDKEWRFHDVPLSGYFSGHEVVVGWEITSDEGLELGGWHLDDVCIVANPYAICGDGVKTPTEQCDTGADLADRPDVCRTDCRLPKCGDTIVDTGEECDEGPEGDALCSDKCETIEPVGDGCCSSTPDARGPLLLAGMLGGLALRRRRRRR
jgi:MYXO-CTERM domain-containing protein